MQHGDCLAQREIINTASWHPPGPFRKSDRNNSALSASLCSSLSLSCPRACCLVRPARVSGRLKSLLSTAGCEPGSIVRSPAAQPATNFPPCQISTTPYSGFLAALVCDASLVGPCTSHRSLLALLGLLRLHFHLPRSSPPLLSRVIPRRGRLRWSDNPPILASTPPHPHRLASHPVQGLPQRSGTLPRPPRKRTS